VLPKKIGCGPALRSHEALSLIAALRGIGQAQVDEVFFKKPIALAEAVDRYLKQKIPSEERINCITQMRNHWKTWFANTLWAECWPEKLDRRQTLWLRVPNPILKQQLQFRENAWKTQLNQRLGKVCVKEIRWWVGEVDV
jgi:hypothetical protein